MPPEKANGGDHRHPMIPMVRGRSFFVALIVEIFATQLEYSRIRY